jgi:hypothetical protein
MAEEIVRKAIRQNRPDVTFLKQEGVAAESGPNLKETLGHARAATHALLFRPEHLRSYGSLPDGLERRRFPEVALHLPFQNHPRYRLLEWLRRPNLVGVVHPLDGLLGPDAVLERQIAGDSPGGGSK